MLKIKFLLLSLSLVPIMACSQQSFLKGYVVTKSGDTLDVYVKAKESEKNPSSIKFKTSLDGEVKQMSVEESRGFGVFGQEEYERHFVNISTAPVKLSAIIGGIDTASTNESVFLKIIERGPKATLYVYTDHIKKRFYIRDVNSEIPFELMLFRYYANENGTSITTNSKFRNQISALFKQYGVSEKENDWLKRTKYEQYDLVRALALINNKEDGEEDKTKKTLGYSWYFGGGVGSNRYSYSGSSPLTSSEFSQHSSVYPYVAVGADFYFNSIYKKLLLKTELSFYSSKNETVREVSSANNTEKFKHMFKMNSVTLGAHIVYNFYNSVKNRVYIGAGVSSSYIKISENNYTYSSSIGVRQDLDPAKFNKLSWTTPLSLGTVVNNRFELSVGYEIPTPLTMNGYISIDVKRFRTGLNYHFN